MHEDIVHPLHDAVTVHPNVLAVAVVPIPVDPNPARAGRNLLRDHHGLWRRRGLQRCGGRDGLLDDDHRLAIDLLRRAFLGFDDHVGNRSLHFAHLPFSSVAIV
jgi:hypothetical protein